MIDQAVLYKVLAANRDGIVIADARQADQPVIYVNPAFERITGYPQVSVLGRNCRFLQGRERNQPARRTIREALAEGIECSVTLRNFRRDGTPFWNRLGISPISDGAGGPSYYAGIISDVTAVAEAERSLSGMRDALAAARAELRENRLWDEAVGLRTRRYFEEILAREWATATRDWRTLAVARMALDGMSERLMEESPQASLEFLRRVAEMLQASMRRAGDLVCLHHPTDFSVLLTGPEAEDCEQVAAYLLRQLDGLALPHPDGGHHARARIGVASMIPAPGTSAQSLVAAAEEALQAALRLTDGRRIVKYEPAAGEHAT